MRTLDRSAAADAGESTIICSITDARIRLVTPWSSITASMDAGRASLSMTRHPPAHSVPSEVPAPAMWNIGRTESTTEVGSTSQRSAVSGMHARILARVSMAPFGFPVVPDVYSCSTTSSGEEASATGSADCASRHAVQPWARSPATTMPATASPVVGPSTTSTSAAPISGSARTVDSNSVVVTTTRGALSSRT